MMRKNYDKNDQEKLVKSAQCPACDMVIQLQVIMDYSELINCPYCNALLQLRNQHPPTLDWAEDPLVISSHRIFKKMF